MSRIFKLWQALWQVGAASSSSKSVAPAKRYPGLELTGEGWFYVRKGEEKAALNSLRELVTAGYAISLADHSRDDCEGACVFELRNGKLECTRGRHGSSTGPSPLSWQRFEALFEELRPFNDGADEFRRGYLTIR